MKQVLQNYRTGQTTIEDVPVPKPKPGSALIRTASSLVSVGTERMLVKFAEKSLLGKARSRPDLLKQVIDKARREGLLTAAEVAFNRLDQAIPLGYSSAGTIVELGENVEGFRVGQRVACAGGGYAVHAEFALVPQNLLTLLPDNVEFDSAAFTTVGAIALHGLRLAECQIGERVAVVGLGLLGMLTAGITLASGCQVIGIDLNPARVKLAESLGVKAVTRNEAEQAVKDFSRGRGVDAVLICADTPSSDPIDLAGVIARDRANIVAIGAVGLNVPRKIYFDKELSLINSRSYGPGRYDPEYEEGGQDYPVGYVRWTEGRNMEAIVDLLSTGQLDVRSLITHRFPIDRALEAYQLITEESKESYLGILLNYPEQALTMEAGIGDRYIQTTDNQTNHAAGVRLGVFGAGNYATTVLFPILSDLDGVELVGVATPSAVSAKHAADKFGFQYATSDIERILEDASINTITILTRHNLHADQLTAAIKMGKHVFCEKPLAITHEELSKISDHWGQVVDDGLLITVGFNRRFSPLAQRMYNFVRKSPDPLYVSYRVNAGYLPLDHWLHDPKQGGGRIIGEACHFIDFLVYLVGAPPEDVLTSALPDQGRYRTDNVQMTFKFPDGSIGTVTYLANGDRSFPKERVEVFSGGRIAILEDYRVLTMVKGGHRKVERSRFRQDKGHRGLWESFITTILEGGLQPIPYEHIFGVTKAALFAMDSLNTGQKVEIY